MKILTLEWTPDKGPSSHTKSEACNIGPYRAYIGRNTGADGYSKPYQLYVSCRVLDRQHSMHTTVEEAKQVATQELSENVYKLYTELGYLLSQ